METSHPYLFQEAIPSTNSHESSDSGKSNYGMKEINQLGIRDLDHHMIEIVAAYIRRLPDNITRKYIARIMINSIIKSANL
jgi:hypothetical protein